MARKKKTQEAPESQVETQTFTDERDGSSLQTVEELNTKSNTAIPPIQLRRNEYGLLESVNYKYRDDGFVDWRAMVRPEHLYPNKDKTKETDVTKLRDDQLVIKLGGLRELAQIRGYNSFRFNVTCPSRDYVVVSCEVEWLPNYETENRTVTTSAISTSHYDNSKSFMQLYLGEQSENRSLARAIRSFLGINIVSHEELSDKKEEPEKTGGENSPYATLENCMKNQNLTFEKLKEKCIKAEAYTFDNPEKWNSIKDISKKEVFYIMSVLNKKN